MRISPLILALAAGFLLSQSALAQQAETFGDYTVHYNTMNTNLLPPDVARSYGIQRAGTRAMLNIAVLRQPDNSPVHARVTATATNLAGQLRDIRMREVADQEAIYYIGQFRVHDEETLNFKIEIEPRDNTTPPMELRFRQQFFTD